MHAQPSERLIRLKIEIWNGISTLRVTSANVRLFQPPKTAFDDYMDYRMNRVHRGAMVRSILNQVELDPKPTRYRPLPITSIK